MTKFLFILSALVMIVAAVFAFQNNGEFTKVRQDKFAKHDTIKKELGELNTLVADINKKSGEVSKVQGEVDVAAEQLKAQKIKIAQADSETKRSTEELESKQTKLAELKKELDKLPPGVKAETLAEDLNKMKQEIATLESTAEQKKKEVQAEEKKVADARRVLEDIVRKVEERKKAFDRNGLTANVVAVNNDWGFVVIDAGEKEGITPDTKLLVTRGTQTIGKLSILSVEGGRTVANILEDTVVKGLAPAPGDRVILENLYQ